MEIHVKASDWRAHGHSGNPAYDNVVLHVVWEFDTDIPHKDGSAIPTLELRGRIPMGVLASYKTLMAHASHNALNCAHGIAGFKGLKWDHWLERLFLERLERKSSEITSVLASCRMDWEKVLLVLLFKGFGSKVNGRLFFEVAQGMDVRIVRKLKTNPLQMEAFFMGMMGLLDEVKNGDSYQRALQKEFGYLSKKYSLELAARQRPEFVGSRPANFPTIRLAQLAALFCASDALFQSLITSHSSEIYTLLQVTPNRYWDTHYNFGKNSKKRKKTISKTFARHLIINIVVPLRFSYAASKGSSGLEGVLELMMALPPEKNGILKKFENLDKKPNNAMEGQGLLQLYNEYCTKNHCLRCAVGTSLLKVKA